MPSLKDETIGINASAQSVAELEQTVSLSERLRDAKRLADDAAEFRTAAGKLLVQMVSLEVRLVEAAIEVGKSLAKAAIEDRQLRRDHYIMMDKRRDAREDKLLNMELKEREARLVFECSRFEVEMAKARASLATPASPDNGVDAVDVPGFGQARVNDDGELELNKDN